MLNLYLLAFTLTSILSPQLYSSSPVPQENYFSFIPSFFGWAYQED